jgi:hypothetical protein
MADIGDLPDFNIFNLMATPSPNSRAHLYILTLTPEPSPPRWSSLGVPFAMQMVLQSALPAIQLPTARPNVDPTMKQPTSFRAKKSATSLPAARDLPLDPSSQYISLRT